MTIKGCWTSFKLKSLSFYFVLASLAAIVLRSVQILKFIDVETGFYDGGTIVNVLLVAVLLAASVWFVVSSFLSAESKKLTFTGKKNVPAAVCCLIFVVALFGFGANKLMFYSVSGGYEFKDLMLSGVLPNFLQGVFALISGVYFMIFALDLFKGTEKVSNRRILALAPLGYCAFRLVGLFVKQISFIKVSDLFFELLMVSLMMLFYMSLAEVNGGVYSDDNRWRLNAFGLPAALLALMLSVPKLIFTFVNSEKFVNAEYPFQLIDLIFGLFVLVLSYYSSKNLTAYTAEEYEEKAQ